VSALVYFTVLLNVYLCIYMILVFVFTYRLYCADSCVFLCCQAGLCRSAVEEPCAHDCLMLWYFLTGYAWCFTVSVICLLFTSFFTSADMTTGLTGRRMTE